MSRWLSNQEKKEKCWSVLKNSHISSKKMRSKILAPLKLLGALTLPSRKAGSHHRFLAKAHQSSASSLRIPLSSSTATCLGVKARGRADGRNSLSKWIPETFRDLLCPGMAVPQPESPILVWECGGCLPEEACFILRGKVTLAATSAFLEMSNSEMSSLSNGCPAPFPCCHGAGGATASAGTWAMPTSIKERSYSLRNR